MIIILIKIVLCSTYAYAQFSLELSAPFKAYDLTQTKGGLASYHSEVTDEAKYKFDAMAHTRNC